MSLYKRTREYIGSVKEVSFSTGPLNIEVYLIVPNLMDEGCIGKVCEPKGTLYGLSERALVLHELLGTCLEDL